MSIRARKKKKGTLEHTKNGRDVYAGKKKNFRKGH